MEKIFDLAAWREILVGSFSEMGSNIAGFLPNVVGAAIILIVGFIVSRALEAITSRGLRTAGLDRAAARLQVAEVLDRAGSKQTLSQIVAKLFFWLVMLTFVLSSVETLGLSAVTATIDRLIAFIPSVIGAAFITIGGLLLGRFVSTLVSSGAAAAGILSASRLGFLSQLAVSGLVFVLAAEQLGIATSIFVLPFTVALGTAGFGIGLAFALGARPVITHIMAGHFVKQSLAREVSIEIGGRRGLVQRVGAIDTLMKNDDQMWTVPNGQILDQIVLR